MGLIEDFRRVAAGRDAAELINEFLGSGRGHADALKYVSLAMDQSYQKMLAEALFPWARRLAAAIPTSWYHPDVHRKCDMSLGKGKCTARAIAMCSSCRRDVCLTHSFVCVDGQVICYGCVNVARKHADPVVNTAPGPEERTQPPQKAYTSDALNMAYEILGVSESDDMKTIKKARDKLFRKWHPDRVQSDQEKKEHEIQYKKVGLAFDVIEKSRK